MSSETMIGYLAVADNTAPQPQVSLAASTPVGGYLTVSGSEVRWASPSLDALRTLYDAVKAGGACRCVAEIACLDCQEVTRAMEEAERVLHSPTLSPATPTQRSGNLRVEAHTGTTTVNPGFLTISTSGAFK